MLDEAISTIQEDIAKDLYEMATCHKEEASRIMPEFDKRDVNTSVHLENLAAEQRSQTLGLGASKTDKPRPSMEGSTNSDEDTDGEDDDEEDDNEADNDAAENEGNNHDQHHEPSIFDILDDDAEDELDDDLPLDQQEWRGTVGSLGKALAHERAKCYPDRWESVGVGNGESRGRSRIDVMDRIRWLSRVRIKI